jgi:hypothetical protein
MLQLPLFPGTLMLKQCTKSREQDSIKLRKDGFVERRRSEAANHKRCLPGKQDASRDRLVLCLYLISQDVKP